MSSIKNKKLEPTLFHCLNLFLNCQARSRQISNREKANQQQVRRGKYKKGIRLADSDDKIAPFSIPNYEKLVSKHPKDKNAPNPENFNGFFRYWF